MKTSIAIVASRFNEEYVDGLISSATELLKGHEILLKRVPGAFEIPLAVQTVIRKKRPSAVIAFGLIWKGKTLHADLLATSVTNALMQIQLNESVPVIHHVLTVSNAAEAKARCFGNRLNRGREAAEAALALIGDKE